MPFHKGSFAQRLGAEQDENTEEEHLRAVSLYNHLRQEVGKTMRSTRLLQLAFALVVAGSAALAAPITWTINATLDDGATVTGSFVFDPDLVSNLIPNYNINISAATPGTLSGLYDYGLPTSVFFPFDYTPANSTAFAGNQYFAFYSDANFADPLATQPENLRFEFVPVSPLTDASSTLITNSNINVNSNSSDECFDCNPYVCFAGAAERSDRLCGSVALTAALLDF
jgi:hypothetical protein